MRGQNRRGSGRARARVSATTASPPATRHRGRHIVTATIPAASTNHPTASSTPRSSAATCAVSVASRCAARTTSAPTIAPMPSRGSRAQSRNREGRGPRTSASSPWAASQATPSTTSTRTRWLSASANSGVCWARASNGPPSHVSTAAPAASPASAVVRQRRRRGVTTSPSRASASAGTAIADCTSSSLSGPNQSASVAVPSASGASTVTAVPAGRWSAAVCSRAERSRSAVSAAKGSSCTAASRVPSTTAAAGRASARAVAPGAGRGSSGRAVTVRDRGERPRPHGDQGEGGDLREALEPHGGDHGREGKGAHRDAPGPVRGHVGRPQAHRQQRHDVAGGEPRVDDGVPAEPQRDRAEGRRQPTEPGTSQPREAPGQPDEHRQGLHDAGRVPQRQDQVRPVQRRGQTEVGQRGQGTTAVRVGLPQGQVAVAQPGDRLPPVGQRGVHQVRHQRVGDLPVGRHLVPRGEALEQVRAREHPSPEQGGPDGDEHGDDGQRDGQGRRAPSLRTVRVRGRHVDVVSRAGSRRWLVAGRTRWRGRFSRTTRSLSSPTSRTSTATTRITSVLMAITIGSVTAS